MRKRKPDDGSTRRQFLTQLTTSAVVAGTAEHAEAQPAGAQLPAKLRGAAATSTVCPFCGVGCGQTVHARDGRVINIEGDPAHPVSEGTLCSKGAAAIQVVNNPHRLKTVLYRAPRATTWEERPWDWVLDRIATRVKGTRDATFQDMVGGRRVSRTEAIGCLGGSALDNEEAYLLTKLMRGLGLVYLEHQARL